MGTRWFKGGKKRKLEGKTAIVTGGARGLGKAFCLAVAGEGASVAVVDILGEEAEKTAEGIRANGESSMAFTLDVTGEEETKEMAGKVIQRFGRIDILVNNAALIYGLGRRPFHEVSFEEWKRLMDVNFGGFPV